MQQCRAFTASRAGVVRPARLIAVRSATPASNAAVASQCAKNFLQDCTALGTCRFIVVGQGAILETVNDFSSVKYTDVPNRGLLATVASPDKTFECHINLSKVNEVRLAKSKAKTGSHDVYAARFVAQDGTIALTCLLHGQQGQYAPEAVEAWTGLVAKYGETVALAVQQ